MSNNATHDGDAQDKFNIFLGGLEPERKKISEWLRRVGPKINSKSLKRLLGAFKAFLDSKTNNLPPVLGVMLKQVTEIIDDAFLDGPGGHETEHHKEEEAAVIVDDWTKKVFGDAVEQIRNSDDAEEVAKKFKSRVNAIMGVMDEIERLKTQRKTTASTDHQPDEDSFSETLGHVWSGIIEFFKSVRVPFLIYAGIVLFTILIAFASVIWVLDGVASGSQSMIFQGGIALMLDTILVAVVLLPAMLGVNIFRAIARIFRGN